ncbi:hypothetical protein [Citrobacter sp. RHBSTW-00881]|uniref:hypothetical protein n=1 Tax=Citrobacter sp. RHBSTW-00881 TaxID=2742667 RepID=UPI0015E96D34|nr:hypothetical protein [Citrobacter sp. RHBSTW-00881]QLS66705.1 hypothetical protein HV311_19825 [Citrobacter sp. RHBSTW-00881]
MKQVTMESVKQRINELTSTGIVSLRGDFELACLRELVAVTEQRDALVAENANILAPMHEQSGCFNAAIAEGFHEAVMQSGIENLIDVYQRRLQPAIQCIPPTPTTDAAIAALRAEGVAMFAAEMSAEHKKLQSGGYFDRQVLIYAKVSDMAESFARQLRESKGEVQS